MLRKKIIGRQPTEHGEYIPGQAYGKKFIVTLFDCGWESKHDNNTSAPATLNAQTGTITENTTDWKRKWGSYKQWLIDNGYQKMDATNVKDGNLTQHEINEAVAGEIGTNSTPESIKGRITDLESVVGDGGSVDERIAEEGARHYLKNETYTKEEVNGMITTPDQEYVSVEATDQTTAATDVLPATGVADTIYRVGNWDGSQYNTTCYTEYTWNGSTYVKLSTKEVGIDDEPTTGSDNLVKSGGVADAINNIVDTVITVNILEEYAYYPISIPAGKTIKSINFSGNRLWAYDSNKQNSTLIWNGISVLAQPLAIDVAYINASATGNVTIIVSGEVQKQIDLLDQKVQELEGKRFVELHSVSPEDTTFFNKNLFDKNAVGIVNGKFLQYDGTESVSDNYLISDYIPISSNIEKLIISHDGQSFSEVPACLCLYDSNKQFISGTGKQESTVNGIATYVEGAAYVRFSIPNSYTNVKVEIGNVITEYIPYGEQAIYKEYIPKTNVDLFVQSLMGEDAGRASVASMADGESLVLNSFPYHLKKGNAVSICADITTFSKILFGKGYNQYRGNWLEIDGTNISLKQYNDDGTVLNFGTLTHGLSISTFVKAVMHIDGDGIVHVILQTLGGYYENTFEHVVYEDNYAPFILSDGSALTNVELNATNEDFRKPVWAFGDSYFGVNEGRVMGCLKNFGYFNLLVNGLGGQTSDYAYEDFIRCLNFGTPKYLIWCLGMNDSNPSSFETYFELVRTKCEQLGITMIACTIPTVPERDKETISAFVRVSGLRYIDAYKAVGANSNGVWHSGYLSSDNVHPTALGAQAIASQWFIDFPEIMQYGIKEIEST